MMQETATIEYKMKQNLKLLKDIIFRKIAFVLLGMLKL